MVTFNVDSLDFVDDEEARFGAGGDFATRFDSANSRLELEDLNAGAVGYIPQDISTDLVGGKFAETVSEGKALADDGSVYDTIQQAVNNAQSWVKVGPGYFRESVTIDTAGLTLEGSGERTVIKNFDTTAIISPDTVSDVTIRNLSIDMGDGNDTNAHATELDGDNATVKNVTVTRSGDFGIIVRGSDVTVIGCIVSNTFEVAIHTPNTFGQGGVIANNIVKDASGNAINSSARDDNIIANNVVDGSFIGVAFSGSDVIVIGNRIDNSTSNGITINTGSNDSIVANNRISNSSGSDISDAGTGTVLDANLTT